MTHDKYNPIPHSYADIQYNRLIASTLLHLCNKSKHKINIVTK